MLEMHNVTKAYRTDLLETHAGDVGNDVRDLLGIVHDQDRTGAAAVAGSEITRHVGAAVHTADDTEPRLRDIGTLPKGPDVSCRELGS